MFLINKSTSKLTKVGLPDEACNSIGFWKITTRQHITPTSHQTNIRVVLGWYVTFPINYIFSNNMHSYCNVRPNRWLFLLKHATRSRHNDLSNEMISLVSKSDWFCFNIRIIITRLCWKYAQDSYNAYLQRFPLSDRVDCDCFITKVSQGTVVVKLETNHARC